MFKLWNFWEGYLVVVSTGRSHSQYLHWQAILERKGGTNLTQWCSVPHCITVSLKNIMRVWKFHYHVRFKDFMVNKLNSWDGTDCIVTRIWAGWFGFRSTRNASLLQNAQTSSGGQPSLLDEYWALFPHA